jgi:hypothetical protein
VIQFRQATGRDEPEKQLIEAWKNVLRQLHLRENLTLKLNIFLHLLSSLPDRFQETIEGRRIPEEQSRPLDILGIRMGSNFLQLQPGQAYTHHL